ncbi:Kelch-like protein 40 [Pseudocercospora fuligena]|uniref:Kelch-like protein 40 n=1 Tax=Pseudocercospora fuligena TaxID=685502 RepID=A0A8H6VCR0_9PEZI|nr:Kelch-like protein 40 [Pseudocercospora fuligena]
MLGVCGSSNNGALSGALRETNAFAPSFGLHFSITSLQISCKPDLSKLRSDMSGPDSDRNNNFKAFVKGLQDSYNNALFSDLIVKCQDMERRVHKIVVCKHSTWFAKACTSDFKEGKCKTIEVHEDDPEILDAVLKYCYAFEVDAGGSFLRAVKIFATAEKYMMESLQRAAAAEFARLFHPSLWAALTPNGEDSITEHADAIKEAYTTTSDPDKILRTAIINCATLKPSNLEGDVTQWLEYQEIIKSHPEFSVDLAMRLAQTGILFNTVRVRVRCQHHHFDSVGLEDVLNVWGGEEIESTCRECPGHHVFSVTAPIVRQEAGQDEDDERDFGGW